MHKHYISIGLSPMENLSGRIQSPSCLCIIRWTESNVPDILIIFLIHLQSIQVTTESNSLKVVALLIEVPTIRTWLWQNETLLFRSTLGWHSLKVKGRFKRGKAYVKHLGIQPRRHVPLLVDVKMLKVEGDSKLEGRNCELVVWLELGII